MKAYVGTAGWALPTAERHLFDDGVSNLARYASRFDGVEINSSFHRRHRPDTWARWADSVPDDFRFSVKLPKTITHVHRLQDCDDLIDEFADDTRGLGDKFAVVLVQLAPKHAFDALVAEDFFAKLRARVGATIVCEPRHASWFERAVDDLLVQWGVARVAADPAPVPAASCPGGSPAIRYWRLHGSPVIYRSSYDPDAIERYATAMREAASAADAWCIFDNTASSAATRNALDLASALSP
jgi:uncharacterized protein YecE (DUF72 family)